MSGYPWNQPPYPGTHPAGFAQPPAGYAQPPAGYAPPPAGYAPPPASYAPPPAGFVPPPAGYPQPPAGYAPPPHYPTGPVARPEAAPGYGPGHSASNSTVTQTGSVPRRYFFIVSEMNGNVLDVDGGHRAPGTRAIMWSRKAGASDNQLWYRDEQDVIHSKLTGFVLQSSGNIITLMKPNNHASQMWTISGNRIVLKYSPEMCLDIMHEDRKNGAELCQYHYKGSSNQHWRFEYTAPSYFVIRSQLHGKVLDVEGNNSSPGARVIMWPLKRPPGANQQWYIDEQGIIHSRLNNFALQPGGGESGMVLMRHDNRPSQQWTIHGQAIVLKSEPNKCLDIHSANRADGAKLCSYRLSKAPNQLWCFDFL